MAWNDMSMMQVMHYEGGPMAYAKEQIDKGALHVVALPRDIPDDVRDHYKEYRGEDFKFPEGRHEMVQMGQPGEGWVGSFKVGDMLDITDPQNPKGVSFEEFHDLYGVLKAEGKDVRTPEPKPGFEPVVDTRIFADDAIERGAMRVTPKLPGYFDMVQTDKNISFLDAQGKQHDVEKGGFIGFPMMGPSTYSPESFTYDKLMNEIGIVSSSGKDVMKEQPQAERPKMEGRIYGDPNRGREVPFDLGDDKLIDPIGPQFDGTLY